MASKLKVFRMPIGFEDAYVAAPSRKAALAAWGAEHDQFARGVAEEVTDAALAKEPLAHPGEVIRKSRGDLAAQLKARPPRRNRPKIQSAPSEAKPVRKAAKPQTKTLPPPKRDKLDEAEAAIDQAQRRNAAEIAGLEDQLETIELRLEALRAKREKELGTLARKRDAARAAYRDALEAWSGA